MTSLEPTNLRRIWRLENEEGVGYYCGNYDVHPPHAGGGCPTPQTDEGLSSWAYAEFEKHGQFSYTRTNKSLSPYVCGFKDLEQFARWFVISNFPNLSPYNRSYDYKTNTYTEKDTKHGLMIAVYEVEAEFVQDGECQVMFERTKARRVHMFEINTDLRQYEYMQVPGVEILETRNVQASEPIDGRGEARTEVRARQAVASA